MMTLDDVKRALAAIRDAIYLSPLGYSETLSEWTGKRVYLKLENLQMTGSFKERGALNKLLHLSDEEKRQGVITASAGNHAQGVAYHARRLGIRAAIVMPEPTPLIKVTSTKELGAEVILHGANYDEAYHYALDLSSERDLVFIHPFDDQDIIAGQGTIGLELLEQEPGIETVVVPVGGGGLIAGMAIALKETNPKIKLIGVEAERIPSMKVSLEQGTVTELPPTTTLADGIAVRRVGECTFPLVQNYVDQMVTVTEEEIANAILVLIEREKSVVEGAGAVGLAALLNRRFWVKERKIALILSGGNIDVTMISRIIERGLAKDGRLVRLDVKLPDIPGSLHQLTGVVADCRANITEIAHNRAFARGTIGETEVVLTLETRGREHIEEILRTLREKGYQVEVGV
jgi:threonine dehydratase